MFASLVRLYHILPNILFNYADGLAKILLGVTYCTTNHYCCNHSTIIIAKRRPAGLDNAGLISVWGAPHLTYSISTQISLELSARLGNATTLYRLLTRTLNDTVTFKGSRTVLVV